MTKSIQKIVCTKLVFIASVQEAQALEPDLIFEGVLLSAFLQNKKASEWDSDDVDKNSDHAFDEHHDVLSRLAGDFWCKSHRGCSIDHGLAFQRREKCCHETIVLHT